MKLIFNTSCLSKCPDFSWILPTKQMQREQSPIPKPIGIWKLNHWYFSKISLHLLTFVTPSFHSSFIIDVNRKNNIHWRILVHSVPFKIPSLVLYFELYVEQLLVKALALYHKFYSLTHWCSIWKFKCPVNQSLKKDCSTLQVAKTCKEKAYIRHKWTRIKQEI